MAYEIKNRWSNAVIHRSETVALVLTWRGKVISELDPYEIGMLTRPEEKKEETKEISQNADNQD